MLGTLLRRLWDALARMVRTVLSSPMALISAPRRLMGLSLPARVAFFMFVFLVAAAATAYVVWLLDKQNPYIKNYLTRERILGIGVLLAVIPPFTYWTVKLWMEGETSPWPDIDIAWKQGLRALAESGVDLHTTPIFLILGPRNEREAQALFAAAQLNLRVPLTPDKYAALHWGASSEAIYLVCTDANCLSELARRGPDNPLSTAAAPAAPALNETLQATLTPGAVAPRAAEPSPYGQAPNFYGTLDAGLANLQNTVGTPGPNRPPPTVVAQLDKKEVTKQGSRLAYVCELLRKARQPVCPANGVLTVLPFSLIQHSDSAAVAVRYAVKNDLETAVRELRLRCPVVALVGEMETEAGFQELVRRVGPLRAKSQRFGKGFNVWNAPLGEQVEAVSTHACGAFEDWTYALFREKGGLQKVRNKQLYALLCKVRHGLRKRLEDILVNAYGYEGESPPEKLLFGGCYFAATGDREDQQAFVKSVFEKLLQEESELDWSEAALAEDRRYQGWANVALTIALLAGLAVAAILTLYFLGHLQRA